MPDNNVNNNMTLTLLKTEYSKDNDKCDVFHVPINRLSEPHKAYLRNGKNPFQFKSPTNTHVLVSYHQLCTLISMQFRFTAPVNGETDDERIAKETDAIIAAYVNKQIEHSIPTTLAGVQRSGYFANVYLTATSKQQDPNAMPLSLSTGMGVYMEVLTNGAAVTTLKFQSGAGIEIPRGTPFPVIFISANRTNVNDDTRPMIMIGRISSLFADKNTMPNGTAGSYAFVTHLATMGFNYPHRRTMKTNPRANNPRHLIGTKAPAKTTGGVTMQPIKGTNIQGSIAKSTQNKLPTAAKDALT